MAYAPQSKIQIACGGADKLLQLADQDKDLVVDADVIAAVQAATDGWIDGFAALRYAVPIENPTDTLVQLAAEECAYRLRKDKGALRENDITDHNERLEYLKLLNAGKVRPSDPAPTKSDAVRSQSVVNNRDASRTNLKGFV